MTVSFDKADEWRSLLKKIGDNLLLKNIDDIIFLLDIPAGVKENIGRDGFSVLMKLNELGEIDEENPKTLIDCLEDVERYDLTNHVHKFNDRCTAESRRLAEAEQEKSELKMRATPSGLCLIISNKDFASIPVANGTESSREASECLEGAGSYKQASKYDRPYTVDDEVSLEQTFKWLGFEVEVKRNCTIDEIHKELYDIADKDHAMYDAFVCCILTHGYTSDKEEAFIFGTDWKEELLVNIQRDLEGRNCESLLEKPKMFFVQACSEEDVVSRARDSEQARKVDGSRATESDETKKSNGEKRSAESSKGKPLRATESMDEEAPEHSFPECRENASLGTLSTDEVLPEQMEQQTFDGDINERNGSPATPDNSREARPAPDPVLPSVKNFLSFISTHAEPAENAKKGSTFVSTLCDVFQKQACDQHLTSMLISAEKQLGMSRPIRIGNLSFSKIYFNPSGPFPRMRGHLSANRS